MKYLIIYILSALLLFNYTLFSQSLSVFGIDASEYPLVKAKYYAFDKEGNQITNLSAGDFSILDNGIPTNVEFLSCPPPSPSPVISGVITIDVSGSMTGQNILNAKEAAKAWINALPEDNSECAVTSFTTSNYIHQDFTDDKEKLLEAVQSLKAGGGTDFNAGFIKEAAGALLTAEQAEHKKVIIFLTDGHADGNQTEIINKANEIGAIVFCVTLGTKCPDILRNISEQTGGQWFENITTVEQAKDVFLTIMQISRGSEPCDIHWTGKGCEEFRHLEAGIPALGIKANTSYIIEDLALPSMFVSPSSGLPFGKVLPGTNLQKKVTITAKKLPITVNGAVSDNPRFKVIDFGGKTLPFDLDIEQSAELTVEFSPLDSALTYAKIEIESNACGGNFIYCRGGFPGVYGETPPLRVTHPNGGEIFAAGSDTLITWEGILPQDTVVIEFSSDNGTFWKTIKEKAVNLETLWDELPLIESDRCLIKVSQWEDKQNADTLPDTEWINRYGGSKEDKAFAILQTIDRGFLIAGYTNSSNGDVKGNNGKYDYLIVKTDENGKLQWTKNLGGSEEDYATALCETIDNGYVIAGYTWSSDGDVSKNNGEFDFWFVKLNAEGHIQWEKSYGGSKNEWLQSIDFTSDGGFIAAGFTESRDGDLEEMKGMWDYWIVKLDGDGNLVWQKTFGGSSSDEAYCVKEVSSGGYIAAGYTFSNDGDISQNKGTMDGWVVRLDGDGNLLWEQCYGGSDFERLYAVSETPDGFIFAGDAASSDGDVSENKGRGDMWIVNTDENGSIIWESSFGGSSYDAAFDITRAYDGGFVAAGLTGSIDGDVSNPKGENDFWLVKTDEQGSLIMEKSFGGGQIERGTAVMITSDRGIAAAGYTVSNGGDFPNKKGNADFCAVKLPGIAVPLQEDVSDSVFSIVMPRSVSKDVNMGQVLVHDIKDSLVNTFFTNTGTMKIRIDSLSISGGDAAHFGIARNIYSEEIYPGSSASAEFSFHPQSPGMKNAEILIHTQSGTVKQSITGEGIEKSIETLTSLIDFGKVYIGTKKDTLLSAVIKNTGTTALNINDVINAGPDNEQFEIVSGGGSFLLNPGETRVMQLRFSANSLGRTSGELHFEYEGTGSPAKVQLFGEAFKVTPVLTTNSPICTGDNLYIYADTIPNAEYYWSGPDGFTSNAQNVVIKNAMQYNSGTYSLYTKLLGLSGGPVYSDTTSINVEIATTLVSPGDSSFIFVGEAERIGDYIRLTEARKWNGGSIWLKNRFTVKVDFATTFAFKTQYGDNATETHETSIPGADGIAFVMQNHNYPVLGEIGGALGYTGITNSLAVEFDLYQNEYDPNGNHAAVQSMGAEPNIPEHDIENQTLGISTDMIEIEHNKMYYAKIEYEWTSKKLIIYLDSTKEFLTPVLTVENIDLTEHLMLEEGEYVYLGITSSTGKAWQEHLIYDWEIPCNNQLVNVPEKYNKSTAAVLISPNPCTDFVNISIPAEKFSEAKINIINILGQQAAVKKSKSDFSGSIHYRFDTSNLPAGAYIITITNEGRTESFPLRVVR